MSRATSAAVRAGKAAPDYPGRELLEAILAPVVKPVAQRVAGQSVQRLLGFWVMWHSYGGFHGLLDARVISRAGVYAQRKEFAEVFGTPIEDFLPQVAAALSVVQLAAGVAPALAPQPAPAPVPAGQLELA